MSISRLRRTSFLNICMYLINLIENDKSRQIDRFRRVYLAKCLEMYKVFLKIG